MKSKKITSEEFKNLVCSLFDSGWSLDVGGIKVERDSSEKFYVGSSQSSFCLDFEEMEEIEMFENSISFVLYGKKKWLNAYKIVVKKKKFI